MNNKKSNVKINEFKIQLIPNDISIIKKDEDVLKSNFIDLTDSEFLNNAASIKSLNIRRSRQLNNSKNSSMNQNVGLVKPFVQYSNNSKNIMVMNDLKDDSIQRMDYWSRWQQYKQTNQIVDYFGNSQDSRNKGSKSQQHPSTSKIISKGLFRRSSVDAIYQQYKKLSSKKKAGTRNNSHFLQMHRTEQKLTVSKFPINNKKKSKSLYTQTNQRLVKFKGQPENSKSNAQYLNRGINQTTLKVIRSLSSPSNNNKSLQIKLKKMDDIVKRNKKNFQKINKKIVSGKKSQLKKQNDGEFFQKQDLNNFKLNSKSKSKQKQVGQKAGQRKKLKNENIQEQTIDTSELKQEIEHELQIPQELNREELKVSQKQQKKSKEKIRQSSEMKNTNEFSCISSTPILQSETSVKLSNNAFPSSFKSKKSSKNSQKNTEEFPSMKINFTTNERNEIAFKVPSCANGYTNKFNKSDKTQIRKFQPQEKTNMNLEKTMIQVQQQKCTTISIKDLFMREGSLKQLRECDCFSDSQTKYEKQNQVVLTTSQDQFAKTQFTSIQNCNLQTKASKGRLEATKTLKNINKNSQSNYQTNKSNVNNHFYIQQNFFTNEDFQQRYLQINVDENSDQKSFQQNSYTRLSRRTQNLTIRSIKQQKSQKKLKSNSQSQRSFSMELLQNQRKKSLKKSSSSKRYQLTLLNNNNSTGSGTIVKEFKYRDWNSPQPILGELNPMLSPMSILTNKNNNYINIIPSKEFQFGLAEDLSSIRKVKFQDQDHIRGITDYASTYNFNQNSLRDLVSQPKVPKPNLQQSIEASLQEVNDQYNEKLNLFPIDNILKNSNEIMKSSGMNSSTSNFNNPLKTQSFFQGRQLINSNSQEQVRSMEEPKIVKMKTLYDYNKQRMEANRNSNEYNSNSITVQLLHSQLKEKTAESQSILYGSPPDNMQQFKVNQVPFSRQQQSSFGAGTANESSHFQNSNRKPFSMEPIKANQQNMDYKNQNVNVQKKVEIEESDDSFEVHDELPDIISKSNQKLENIKSYQGDTFIEVGQSHKEISQRDTADNSKKLALKLKGGQSTTQQDERTTMEADYSSSYFQNALQRGILTSTQRCYNKISQAQNSSTHQNMYQQEFKIPLSNPSSSFKVQNTGKQAKTESENVNDEHLLQSQQTAKNHNVNSRNIVQNPEITNQQLMIEDLLELKQNIDENFQNPLLFSNKNSYEYRKIVNNQQNYKQNENISLLQIENEYEGKEDPFTNKKEDELNSEQPFEMAGGQYQNPTENSKENLQILGSYITTSMTNYSGIKKELSAVTSNIIKNQSNVKQMKVIDGAYRNSQKISENYHLTRNQLLGKKSDISRKQSEDQQNQLDLLLDDRTILTLSPPTIQTQNTQTRNREILNIQDGIELSDQILELNKNLSIPNKMQNDIQDLMQYSNTNQQKSLTHTQKLSFQNRLNNHFKKSLTNQLSGQWDQFSKNPSSSKQRLQSSIRKRERMKRSCQDCTKNVSSQNTCQLPLKSSSSNTFKLSQNSQNKTNEYNLSSNTAPLSIQLKQEIQNLRGQKQKEFQFVEQNSDIRFENIEIKSAFLKDNEIIMIQQNDLEQQYEESNSLKIKNSDLKNSNNEIQSQIQTKNSSRNNKQSKIVQRLSPTNKQSLWSQTYQYNNGSKKQSMLSSAKDILGGNEIENQAQGNAISSSSTSHRNIIKDLISKAKDIKKQQKKNDQFQQITSRNIQ